ncbi:MAG TPA: PEGA domain-containing protein [Blastocatellia bacterium]|nr:PEGA domain-containing protein [Blastocatellia bacterium]
MLINNAPQNSAPKSRRQGHALACCALLILSLTFVTALAQKRGKGVSGGDSAPDPAEGPKRGKGVSAPPESRVPTVVNNTIIKEVRPNEGALVLVAVPGAQVALMPIRAGKPGKPLNYTINQENGTLTLAEMTPGTYKLNLTHPDYNPVTTTITIQRGKPTTVAPDPVSKYGAVLIGGLPAGVSVSLDGKQVDAATPDNEGRLSMQRLLVGDHKLKFSKPGYDDWETKLSIKPGETLPVTAKMSLAVVALTVRAKPNTRVYLNDEEKGIVQPDGSLAVPNLPPGAYKLRVLLDGYETVEKPLSLALDNRKPVETIELTPIAESSEATDAFNQGLAKWSPTPAGWKIEKGSLRVGGSAVALFKDATESRPSNVYRDFTWDFDVSFGNGKGAAWIVRAKDTQNYYLFELTTSKSSQQRKLLNFYVCRNGRLELKDSRNVIEPIEKPGDSFHITVKATGNQFAHTISVASSPSPEAQPLGTFTDSTFSYGGIGFQAVNGMEMIVRSFVVIPNQKSGR